jgi:hypothetical protein
MKRIPALCIVFGLLAGVAGVIHAQTTVILPDTSQTTGVIVNILESVSVTIPSSAMFTVANISAPTVSPAMTVAVSGLTAKSASTGVALSVRAAAAQFTPPQPGAPTWAAADVSWPAGTWTGATGSAGTLSTSAFNTVATCGTNGCSTSGFTFTLAPNPAVTRSGAHTLIVTWKIESLQ